MSVRTWLFLGVVAILGCRLTAGELSDVTFRITYADGRREERHAKADRLPNGDFRARFRTIDMTADMKWLDFAAELDNVLYQAPWPGWSVPETSLVDGYLPTWSIAYNGIIMSTPFYATLDAGTPRTPNGTSDAPWVYRGKTVALSDFVLFKPAL